MTAEVVTFPGETTIDLPPERVLSAALESELSSVAVIGYKEDGELYLASSNAHAPDVVMMLELCKAMILRDCVE